MREAKVEKGNIGNQGRMVDLDYTEYQIRQKIKECKKRGVLICEADPNEFLRYFMATLPYKIPVFLGNPNWRTSEWEQVFEQISPALVLGEAPNFPENRRVAVRDLKPFCDYIMIPTGGSGGKVKFAMHTMDGLANSANATAEFLNQSKIKSLCLLPLYHISGFIQIVRFLVTDGEIIFRAKEIFDERESFDGFCLSLVPTQLERYMKDLHQIEVLKTFNAVFLGGAAATKDLLDRARKAEIRLVPTYGMTETGSMVAVTDFEDFKSGKSGFSALLHAKISFNKEGLVVIQANSLFSGYFPSRPMKKNVWVTDDEGYKNNNGHLEIVGRADRMIITGGEKVDPKQVEQEIMATDLVKAVHVMGMKDDQWGERVVAIYVPLRDEEDVSEEIKQEIKGRLINYKIPKEWIMVDELPFDERGKLSRTILAEKLSLV